MRLYGTEGLVVRVVPCLLLLVGLSLSATGCNLFSKRPAQPGDHPSAARGNATAGPASPPAFADPAFESRDGDGQHAIGSMVAGQIIDNLTGKPPPDATIRVVDSTGGAGKPLEVSADAQGYFTIENLKRGQQYKLEARARQGDKLLAGTTYTNAPNIRVLVKISEDFVTPNTPDVPGKLVPPAGNKLEKSPKSGKKEQATAQRSPQWSPPTEGSINPTVGIGPPQALKEGAASPQQWQQQTIPTPQAPADATRIAEKGSEFAAAPLAKVPTPGPVASKPPEGNPTLPVVEMPARVPSCVLVGKTLYNFALYDLRGQPWEFKKDKRGKVVLLDFWHTLCRPCLESIPHLVGLQTKYGDYGLEIVGIANEQYGSPTDKATRVSGMARVRGINYRLLQGGGPTCPVMEQFGVHLVPTLVLIGEDGQIVWRHTGGLDRAALNDLEWALRTHLKIR
jgi:thiol-disulfide isomerase/thioredoxin